MGVYLGPLCRGYALNCHFDHSAIPGTRLLLIRKQNMFVHQKVKFTSVQINMKQVLETDLQKSIDFLLNPFLYFEMICM